jgi:hypothetical protein
VRVTASGAGGGGATTLVITGAALAVCCAEEIEIASLTMVPLAPSSGRRP